ncbi:hypothetical protein ZHAS_00016848 [Anopheles sinensis]|uniref:Uncharacterized protein n=1 Tax=Anopheles sinensis TaxID=74873 RepID=A0A084WE94_ANOSI|nr:hypothetical protein ZHAS_00016848 [Anopheles sinensis]
MFATRALGGNGSRRWRRKNRCRDCVLEHSYHHHHRHRSSVKPEGEKHYENTKDGERQVIFMLGTFKRTNNHKSSGRLCKPNNLRRPSQVFRFGNSGQDIYQDKKHTCNRINNRTTNRQTCRPQTLRTYPEPPGTTRDPEIIVPRSE